MQQNGCTLALRILSRRIEVKKTTLKIAAAALISIAGGAVTFAAELPTYETTGLPISAMQVQVLGATNVREQSPVATSTASPHQLSVLTPRTKLTAATAPTRTTGLSIR
jgi:hypothetical protein